MKNQTICSVFKEAMYKKCFTMKDFECYYEYQYLHITFGVKGIPKWRFGFLAIQCPMNDEETMYTVSVSLYAIHSDFMDKMKPSMANEHLKRTAQIVLSGDSKADSVSLYSYVYEALSVISFVKTNPIYAYAVNAQGCFYTLDRNAYLECLSAKKNYIKYKLNKFKETELFYRYLQYVKIRLEAQPCVFSVELTDRREKGTITYPAFELKVHFKQIYYNSEKQEGMMNRIIRKYLKKEYYPNLTAILEYQEYCGDLIQLCI